MNLIVIMGILHYLTMHEIDKKMSRIKEFLALKNAQKAELEKQWFAEQISTREFQESMTALDMETNHLKL